LSKQESFFPAKGCGQVLVGEMSDRDRGPIRGGREELKTSGEKGTGGKWGGVSYAQKNAEEY